LALLREQNTLGSATEWDLWDSWDLCDSHLSPLTHSTRARLELVERYSLLRAGLSPFTFHFSLLTSH